jgi:tRNA pseudouridine38-40 synthase
MPRIALQIEYDGTDFLGWQTQQQEPTLQSTLERAVSFVADQTVEVVCSGRTDAGVHALGQVVHFDCSSERDMRSWMLGINSRLPKTACVVWAGQVSDDFHARYSARLRRYRYELRNRPVRSALDARFRVWERIELDVAAMHAAAQDLLGEQDFTSFRTVACQAKSPRRYMHEVLVQRSGDVVSVELQANAFLHHMCRNIVGSLLLIGRGLRPPVWLGAVLAARDRKSAGPTAPGHGLVFLGPRYPREFGLPEHLSLPADFVDPWIRTASVVDVDADSE